VVWCCLLHALCVQYSLTADFSDLREGRVQGLDEAEIEDTVSLITAGKHTPEKATPPPKTPALRRGPSGGGKAPSAKR
jgi:hypothetical protein